MPAGDVKTYDPSQVSIVYAGFLLGGFSEDSMITVTSDEDDWGFYSGVDGEATRNKILKNSATVTFRLAQSSRSNDILSGIRAADKAANTGALPFLMKDGNGSSIYEANTMWIQKRPEAEYGKDVKDREWTLRTGNLIAFDGGIG